MAPEGHPSLPGWIKDAYFPLERYLCDQSDQDSVTHQQATDLIAEANPDFRDADIDHSLSYLLDHGWLYEVDGQLFITEFHESESE